MNFKGILSTQFFLMTAAPLYFHQFPGFSLQQEGLGSSIAVSPDLNVLVLSDNTKHRLSIYKLDFPDPPILMFELGGPSEAFAPFEFHFELLNGMAFTDTAPVQLLVPNPSLYCAHVIDIATTPRHCGYLRYGPPDGAPTMTGVVSKSHFAAVSTRNFISMFKRDIYDSVTWRKQWVIRTSGLCGVTFTADTSILIVAQNGKYPRESDVRLVRTSDGSTVRTLPRNSLICFVSGAAVYGSWHLFTDFLYNCMYVTPMNGTAKDTQTVPVGSCPSALAVLPRVGVFVCIYNEVVAFGTLDSIAMTCMRKIRVAWMAAVFRGSMPHGL